MWEVLLLCWSWRWEGLERPEAGEETRGGGISPRAGDGRGLGLSVAAGVAVVVTVAIVTMPGILVRNIPVGTPVLAAFVVGAVGGVYSGGKGSLPREEPGVAMPTVQVSDEVDTASQELHVIGDTKARGVGYSHPHSDVLLKETLYRRCCRGRAGAIVIGDHFRFRHLRERGGHEWEILGLKGVEGQGRRGFWGSCRKTELGLGCRWWGRCEVLLQLQRLL